jgi:hypothetical protein
MRFPPSALLLCIISAPALAQTGRTPVIVIPGRPDIPVLINGVDASWSVVEGDFGLARPGLFSPTVVYRLPPPAVGPAYQPPDYEHGYFPHTGTKPGYGRLEVIPPPDRPLPPPAPSFRKSWSSSSEPTPADLPSYNPTVISPIIAPTINSGGRRHHRPWLGGSSPSQPMGQPLGQPLGQPFGQPGQGLGQRQGMGPAAPVAPANPWTVGNQPAAAPAAAPASTLPPATMALPAAMTPRPGLLPPTNMSPPASTPSGPVTTPSPGGFRR